MTDSPRSPSPAARLRELIARPGLLLMPCCFDALSARLIEEAGFELPQRPVLFGKVAGCVIGPGAAIVRPRVSALLDWEGELCFVVGKRARHVPAAEALEYVGGEAPWILIADERGVVASDDYGTTVTTLLTTQD